MVVGGGERVEGTDVNCHPLLRSPWHWRRKGEMGGSRLPGEFSSRTRPRVRYLPLRQDLDK